MIEPRNSDRHSRFRQTICNIKPSARGGVRLLAIFNDDGTQSHCVAIDCRELLLIVNWLCGKQRQNPFNGMQMKKGAGSRISDPGSGFDQKFDRSDATESEIRDTDFRNLPRALSADAALLWHRKRVRLCSNRR